MSKLILAYPTIPFKIHVRLASAECDKDGASREDLLWSGSDWT